MSTQRVQPALRGFAFTLALPQLNVLSLARGIRMLKKLTFMILIDWVLKTTGVRESELSEKSSCARGAP